MKFRKIDIEFIAKIEKKKSFYENQQTRFEKILEQKWWFEYWNRKFDFWLNDEIADSIIVLIFDIEFTQNTEK